MKRTNELAVMCDTFRPLKLTTLARDLDDGKYCLLLVRGARSADGEPRGRHVAFLDEASASSRAARRAGWRAAKRRLAAAATDARGSVRGAAGRSWARDWARGPPSRKAQSRATAVGGPLLLPFESRTSSTSSRRSSTRRTGAAVFRPDAEALLPNWRHLPVGYHGRAGTVVVGRVGHPAALGQLGPGEFGPTRELDVEVELGFVVGAHAADFRDAVFGVVLVDDWSARDIQAWEDPPLGPFLGKSFATSISAWVTPLALLEAREVGAPPQESRAAREPARRPRLGARRRSLARAQRRGRHPPERAHALLDGARSSSRT